MKFTAILSLGALLLSGTAVATQNPVTFITQLSGDNLNPSSGSNAGGHCRLDYGFNNDIGAKDRFHLSCWTDAQSVTGVKLMRGDDVLADIPGVPDGNGQDYESSGYLDERAFFREAVAFGVFDVVVETMAHPNGELKATVGNPCQGDGFVTGCYQGDRFQVNMSWQNTPTGPSRQAFSDELSIDTGFFYFFNPDSVETIVKVLDACDTNDHFWVFAAATTDVETTLTVVDTASNQTKTYTNPLGTPFQPILDTQAFATCP